MPTETELRLRLDELLDEEAARFVATVPFAAHLTDASQLLHEGYYLRHRVETVHRIRLTSRTDALALAAMVEEDYDAARLWARYIAEELNHDRMFLRDLRRHGLSDDKVLTTPPLRATRRLIEFLEAQIAESGALAAVAYSLFVEWNSARYSGRVVEKAARQFSPAHVAGSAGHGTVDDDERHYDVMVEIASRLLARHRTTDVLDRLLRALAELFRDYFRELYETTTGRTMISTGP